MRTRVTLFILSAFLFGLLTSEPSYGQTIANDTYGRGGKETTTRFTDAQGASCTKTEVRDPNGVLREVRTTKTYTIDNGLLGVDTYFEESFTKYDCNKNVTYTRGTVSKNNQEIRYSDATFAPPAKKEDGLGKKTSGYKRYLDKEGNLKKERWDPEKETWTEVASLTGDERSVEPRGNICSRNSGANILFIGLSFHGERFHKHGESYFGGLVNYTRKIDERLAARGDLAIYLTNDANIKFNKLFVMAGVNFYPFEHAAISQKVAFAVHGVVGVCNFRQKFKSNNIGSSEAETSFAYAGGIDLVVSTAKGFDIGLQTDFGRTKLFKKDQNNFRLSCGIVKKLGRISQKW